MQRTVRSSCGVARKSCGDFDEPWNGFWIRVVYKGRVVAFSFILNHRESFSDHHPIL